MKAFITGCAGFAGSHLAEHLLEHGQEVVALVRAQDRLRNVDHLIPRIEVVEGDVLDLPRMRTVLERTRPERIYHLAALSSPQDSFQDPWLAYEVNFVGTYNLLWTWHQAQFDSRFLLVSSSQVYGRVSDGDLPLQESAPLRPANPYAGSKATAELLALQFFHSYGLPILRTRPFNHTGPRQDARFVCSSLARQVAEIELGMRDPVVTVGNLKAGRDFSDVRDVVHGYYLLMEKGQPGEVYQLSSGRPVSIETILSHLTALISKTVRVKVDESRLRPQETPAIWGDPSKAARAVGWEPRYELRSTLRDLKEWWTDSLRTERDGASMPAAPSSRTGS